MTQTQTTAATIGQILATLPPIPRLNAPSPNSATDCKHCRGIEQCQYFGHRGYKPIRTEHGTAIIECEHLHAWKVRKRRDNLLNRSNIPLQYRDLTFRDFKYHEGNRQALIAATKLKSLYIWGESGTGKTLLLSLIGNAHIAAGRPTRYTTAAEMLLQLRYNSDACETRLREYQTIPILLIDDLGMERVNEYTAEQLYMVLEGRHRQGKISVLSSHLSLEEHVSNYTERLIEKIRQTVEREEQIR